MGVATSGGFAAVVNGPSAPVGVAVLEALPLARFAWAGLLARTEDFCWRGGTDEFDAALPPTDGDGRLLLLVDSALDPTGDGVRRLRYARPEVTVVSLARPRHRSPGYLQAVLAAGACGVLDRSAPPGELLDGLRRAHRQRDYRDPRLPPPATAEHTPSAGREVALSTREQETLHAVSRGATDAEVAERLRVSLTTAQGYASRLLRKLDARNRAHATARAYQLGLLSPEAPPSQHPSAPESVS